MTKTEDPIMIKKYANRRLYNTGTSTYVTLDDLAEMVRREEDFKVVDAKTGEDITRSVLTQIIFELENSGENMLPVTFLRQLIRFYGDSMQNLVPSYLDASMSALTNEQDKWRSQFADMMGANAFEAIQQQTKRNAELFEQTMRMFTPFGAVAQSDEPESKAKSDESELAGLRSDLEKMRAKLDKLTSDD